MDDPIFEEAKELKPIKPDISLWGKIEDSLIKESEAKQTNIFKLTFNHKTWLSAAAVLIISISLVSIYFYTSPNLDEKVLSASTILKVELTEKSYVQAIELLENQAENQMANIDTELMLLYRDKLTTIETQINQCREAIVKNPGNAHIRKYMLAALQDKKNTLNEIINIEPRSKS